MKQNILLLENVFTQEETQEIIDKYGNNVPSIGAIGEENLQIKARTANGLWIFEEEPIIERFKDIVAGITGLPKVNQEEPHFVRYDVGGEYKLHYDWFQPEADYYNETTKKGGQRVFSCLLYLNENFEGGKTTFPKWGVSVEPTVGSIISWRNMATDGTLEMGSLHAGEPVTKGTKYIVIIWVREKPYNIQLLNKQSRSVPFSNAIKSKAVRG